jgi:pimeloyl-ACP methyl ester carboxylesterase
MNNTEGKTPVPKLHAQIVSSLALVAAATLPAHAGAPARKAIRGAHNIVLVHGAFVDGGGWEAVYHKLEKDGYKVSIVQNSTTSLADDVAATKRVLAMQDGPTILVGHSYGGAVITEAGNDPMVVGLVYIAAYAPDQAESLETLIHQAPADAPPPPLLPPKDGFFTLDKTKFHASFAADLSDERAAFLAAAQEPFGLSALSGKISAAAWRKKPSWYLVTTNDKMISPEQQRSMAKRAGAALSEVKSSHAVYESKPSDVVATIETAARKAR